MESSFIAHRSPEETIDANLLMTLLWRLLKHQQRGRKHLLQGELLDCSQPGLNSSAILLGKDVDAMSWGKYLFWGAITIMISLVAHRLICWILLIPPHKHAHIHSKAKFKKRLLWQQSEPLWRGDNNFWWYGLATTFLFSFLGAHSGREWKPSEFFNSSPHFDINRGKITQNQVYLLSLPPHKCCLFWHYP